MGLVNLMNKRSAVATGLISIASFLAQPAFGDCPAEMWRLQGTALNDMIRNISGKTLSDEVVEGWDRRWGDMRPAEPNANLPYSVVPLSDHAYFYFPQINTLVICEGDIEQGGLREGYIVLNEAYASPFEQWFQEFWSHPTEVKKDDVNESSRDDPANLRRSLFTIHLPSGQTIEQFLQGELDYQIVIPKKGEAQIQLN
ncbi:MAG: hypothetical protein V1735_00345 [Nanoarchaeota archaeon]